MAPPSADVDTAPASVPQQALPSKLGIVPGTAAKTHVSTLTKPLVYSGSLDEYKSFDVTPVIGREYPEARLVDILKDDAKIKDLAIQGMFHKGTSLSNKHVCFEAACLVIVQPNIEVSVSN
jgi:hypothetical protein